MGSEQWAMGNGELVGCNLGLERFKMSLKLLKKQTVLRPFQLKIILAFSLLLAASQLSGFNQLFAVKPPQTQSEQPKPIEILNDHAQLEKVASGFQFIEGPVWHPSGFLLFSDIPADTLYQWFPNQKPQVFRHPTGQANGNTLDRKGQLITAEHERRRVSRTLENGKVVTLAHEYAGKRLNSPNDVVVKSDGSIYFTDPPFGIQKEQEELGFYGVYQLKPDGQLKLLTKDLVRPNGLAFSPDEQKLYVNDSQAVHMRVFEVKPDGTLTNGRIFAEMKSDQPGVPDGMKVDVQGNVYSTGPGGVWIFSPEGQLIGKIPVPEFATNLAWGDRDYKTLYITASKSLYRIRLKTVGVSP